MKKTILITVITLFLINGFILGDDSPFFLFRDDRDTPRSTFGLDDPNFDKAPTSSNWYSRNELPPFTPEIWDKLIPALNDMFNECLNKLKNSPNLPQNAKEILDEFLKRPKIIGGKDGWAVTFCQFLSKGHGETHFNSMEILVSAEYLSEMILKIFNTGSLDDLFFQNLKDELLHEMIHAFLCIGGGMEDECIAHCINNKIDPSHDPRHDKDGTPWQAEDFDFLTQGKKDLDLNCGTLEFKYAKYNEWTEKTGKGLCFCGVSWKKGCRCEEPGGICIHDHPKDRPNDFPDDNYSYYSGLLGITGASHFNDVLPGSNPSQYSYSFYPDILIYNRYNSDEIKKLLDLFNEEYYLDDFEHTDFLPQHKVLVIPSGELTGEQDSELIKMALQRFVEAGNTLIVLGQQYGTDFSNLIPAPPIPKLEAFGWREDQSCYWGSSYFQGMHPILSSLTTERVNVGVDGYFANYPGNSTVLLRRISNQQAALLYYSYGAGTVILSSLFSDWAYIHSQASAEELKLFRDMITFAKNPNKPIPMFDMTGIESGSSSRPSVNLTINMKNVTELAATRAKIKVFCPNRSYLLYEYDTDIAIAPGEENNV